MDQMLRILQRAVQATGSIEDMRVYIAALERAVGGIMGKDQSLTLYLLSQWGERHEDRLPCGIFTSLEMAVAGARKLGQDEFGDWPLIVSQSEPGPGDYGPCIEVTISTEIREGGLEEEQEHRAYYVDQFQLNGVMSYDWNRPPGERRYFAPVHLNEETAE